MNEQSNIMSSFFNRLATEFLEPVIEFVFQNEMDHARLDAVPNSLSEIADELGMTRQAVHYTLKKAETKLEAAEEAEEVK